MKIFVFMALIVPIWIALPMAASAQSDTQSLSDRIDRLNRDVQLLQQQVYKGQVPPPSAGSSGAATGGPISGPALADLDVRMTALEAELRDKTGQIEELNFEINQMKQRLDRLSTDVDFRLTQLEKGQGGTVGAAAGASAPETGKSGDTGEPIAAPGTNAAGTTGLAPGPHALGTIPAQNAKPASSENEQVAAAGAASAVAAVRLPNGAPKDQYEYALHLLIENQYAEAEQAFRLFLKAHPTDALAANAQYWLAESLFVRENYADAAAQFLIGYQKYPQGAKVADNVLKLGLSFENLNKKNEACAAFGKLGKDFPNASATLKRRATEERQRMKCAA